MSILRVDPRKLTECAVIPYGMSQHPIYTCTITRVHLQKQDKHLLPSTPEFDEFLTTRVEKSIVWETHVDEEEKTVDLYCGPRNMDSHWDFHMELQMAGEPTPCMPPDERNPILLRKNMVRRTGYWLKKCCKAKVSTVGKKMAALPHARYMFRVGARKMLNTKMSDAQVDEFYMYARQAAADETTRQPIYTQLVAYTAEWMHDFGMKLPKGFWRFK